MSDREDDDVNDDQPEEDEAKQDGENEALAEALGPDPNDGASRDSTVDLWHHAGGKEYYKSLATLGMEAKTPQHIVCLTSTGHPGVALAAHDLKARAYLLFTKTTSHSIAHGVRLQNTILFRYYYREVMGRAGALKRLRSRDLLTVDLQAPDQEIPFE